MYTEGAGPVCKCTGQCTVGVCRVGVQNLTEAKFPVASFPTANLFTANFPRTAYSEEFEVKVAIYQRSVMSPLL